jgi:transposase
VAEAIRLRDERQLSFRKIAKELQCSEDTVARAYDQGNPKPLRDALEAGERPRRGRYSYLGPETYDLIKAGLASGKRAPEIAAEVGCGVSTVYRIRRITAPWGLQ